MELERSLSEAPVEQPTPRRAWPVYSSEGIGQASDDHFVERDGLVFAGTHLLVDFWEATHLDDLTRMEAALLDAVAAAGATLLHIHLHHFTPNGGISGVAVLAESHVSVHTWPERGFAAFDVFMCGNTRPEESIEVLKRVFCPGRVEIHQHLRGML